MLIVYSVLTDVRQTRSSLPRPSSPFFSDRKCKQAAPMTDSNGMGRKYLSFSSVIQLFEKLESFRTRLNN